MTENTISIDDKLKEVKKLEKNLEAEMEIETEKGHWEQKEMLPGVDYDPKTWIVYGDHEQYNESVWVVDKPAKFIPDNKKRQTARVVLNQLFKYSNWYSVRYSAGLAVGKNGELKGKLPEWTDNLRSKAIKLRHEGDSLVPDIETRKKALDDSINLYMLSGSEYALEILKDAYDNNIPEIRKYAGKLLRKSPIKTWARMNPRKAIALGSGAAGTGIVLATSLVQYLR